MRDHLEDFGLTYLTLGILAGFVWLLATADTADHNVTAACYAKGMVDVSTDAGVRCAAVQDLHPVRA